MDIIYERIIKKYNLINFPYWAIPRKMYDDEYLLWKQEIIKSNKKEKFKASPFVWVISFEVMK